MEHREGRDGRHNRDLPARDLIAPSSDAGLGVAFAESCQGAVPKVPYFNGSVSAGGWRTSHKIEPDICIGDPPHCAARPCIAKASIMKLPHRRQFLHLAAGAAAVPALSSIAQAQSYPSRPIRLVVPFPPGGAFDTVARPWAERVKPLLGTVVIEDIGGAGSSFGRGCGRACSARRL